jgi:hypothetical protein
VLVGCKSSSGWKIIAFAGPICPIRPPHKGAEVPVTMQHQALEPVAVAVLSSNAKIVIQNIFVLLAYFAAKREKIV